MDANKKIKEILKKSGKTQFELADLMGISKKTLDTKFYRGGFYVDELMQIAGYLGYKVALVNDEQQIIFDVSGEVIKNVDIHTTSQ
jgi:transcriptional regulator with XRE-family HTH domain